MVAYNAHPALHSKWNPGLDGWHQHALLLRSGRPSFPTLLLGWFLLSISLHHYYLRSNFLVCAGLGPCRNGKLVLRRHLSRTDQACRGTNSPSLSSSRLASFVSLIAYTSIGGLCMSLKSRVFETLLYCRAASAATVQSTPQLRKPSLAETHPELAQEWHPTKNCDRTPAQFTARSTIKQWWLCKKSCSLCGAAHEWEAHISNRTRGVPSGCHPAQGGKCASAARWQPCGPT